MKCDNLDATLAEYVDLYSALDLGADMDLGIMNTTGSEDKAEEHGEPAPVTPQLGFTSSSVNPIAEPEVETIVLLPVGPKPDMADQGEGWQEFDARGIKAGEAAARGNPKSLPVRSLKELARNLQWARVSQVAVVPEAVADVVGQPRVGMILCLAPGPRPAVP